MSAIQQDIHFSLHQICQLKKSVQNREVTIFGGFSKYLEISLLCYLQWLRRDISFYFQSTTSFLFHNFHFQSVTSVFFRNIYFQSTT